MIWFDGMIKNAVDKVKATNSLLIVFVQGEDKLSNAYDVYLTNETEFNETYTALKILKNSKSFEHFKEIYHTVPVPSVFVIGNNGIPLAVLCSLEPSDFTNVVKNIERNENVFEKNDQDQIDQKSNSQKNGITQVNGEEESLVKRNTNENENIAKIQFRLPSNEIHSSQFPNTCTLYDVKLYVMETLKLGPKIKIYRTYPRIAFTKQDEEKTLTDLLLTPNAAIIIVPCPDEELQGKHSGINYTSSSPDDKNLNVNSENRRPIKKPTSNIHGLTFHEKSDSDSDMNTDNGNSTVQK